MRWALLLLEMFDEIIRQDKQLRGKTEAELIKNAGRR
jgi:hypothetical protein